MAILSSSSGLTPSNEVSQPTVRPNNYNAKKVAEDFESLFTSLMLRSMRRTVSRGDLIPENIGEKIYTSMLDDEYASIIAKNASFGLSDLILREIEKNEGNQPSLSAMGLMNQPWMLDNRFVPYNSSQNFNSLNNRVAHWNDFIEEASLRFNVDKNLISAVIAQESAGNPYAVSRAGAKGLMQLIDTTARDMGVSQVFNPKENITGGTKYLRMLLDRYDGNTTLALASYNAGPAAVERYNGIPPYQETQSYVKSVMALEKRFSEINKENEK